MLVQFVRALPTHGCRLSSVSVARLQRDFTFPLCSDIGFEQILAGKILEFRSASRTSWSMKNHLN